MEDCLKKSRTEQGACRCNESNKKFNLDKAEDYQSTSKLIAKENAIESIKQLKKNLVALSNEIISIAALSDINSIQGCNLDSLKQQFSRCDSESSLYSVIKDDELYNISNLIREMKEKISDYSKPYENNKEYEKVSCNMSDEFSIRLTNYHHMSIFKTLINNIDLSEGEDLHSQISDYLSKNADKQDIARVYTKISSNPIFNQILTNKHLTKEVLSSKDNVNIFKENKQIIKSVTENLTEKCQSTFKKAFENLCQVDKDNSLIDYKDFRKSIYLRNKGLKSPEQESKNVQALIFYCKAKSNEESIDLTAQNQDLNNILKLPGTLSEYSLKRFEKQVYRQLQHDPRVLICSLIPPHGNLLANIEKCKQEDQMTDKCNYLFSYKEMFDTAYKKSKLVNKSEQDSSINTDNHQKQIIGYSWSDYPEQSLLQKPLVQSFIGDKIGNKNSTGLDESENVSKVESYLSQSHSVSDNNSNSMINGVSSSDINRQGQLGNLNGKDTSNSISNIRETASNRSSKSPPDYSFLKRMFQKKNKLNDSRDMRQKDLDVIPKTRKEVVSGVDTISKFQKDRKSRYYTQDYADNLMASSLPSEDFFSDADIEEEIQNQYAVDTNHKPNPVQDILNRFKRNNSPLPPYSMRKFNGDIKKLPGLEVGFITNSNFEGIIGEEIPEVVLFGSLAEDLASMDPDEVLTYDATKGGVRQFASLVKGNKPFIISNNGDDEQRILARPARLTGFYDFLVRSMVEDEDGNLQEKFIPYKEVKHMDNDFKKFYKNVTKAFRADFLQSIYDYAKPSI